jgi:hypothetical protein
VAVSDEAVGLAELVAVLLEQMSELKVGEGHSVEVDRLLERRLVKLQSFLSACKSLFKQL